MELFSACGERQVTLLSSGLPAFLGFSRPGTENDGELFPAISPGLFPTNNGRSLRRLRDAAAVVNKGTTLAAVEETLSLTGRRGETLAGVKGKTLGPGIPSRPCRW